MGRVMWVKRIIAVVLLLLMTVGNALAEPVRLRVGFPSTVGSEALTREVMLEDTWFNAPSSTYNHQLAKLSICMAVASFRDVKAPLTQSDHYLADFFVQAGFEDYRAYGYSEPTAADTISNAIAIRRMADEAGPFVLLAVPVCGQGYGDEWMSNFTIDAGENHTGFMTSAEMVYQRLKDYVRDNDLTGQRIKVWCAGFSRAAAVSNMLAQKLLEDPELEPDNVFCYTFGTPNTTKDPVASPQIFNICGAFDPVPKIPFADWGFGKHGQTLYLPALETDEEYQHETGPAGKVYELLMGSSDDFASVAERNWLVGQVLELVYEFLPESAVYSEGYQAAVIAAYGTKGNLLDKINAMMTTLTEHHEDVSGVARVRDELLTLLSMGVTDTVNMLTGNGGNSIWYDLLSSGILLAHEHFPEMYISWLFSTDDTELLYGQSSKYARLVLTGDVSVRVMEGDQVLMDGERTSLAVTQLNRQTFIALPVGKSYHAVVTARDNTRSNVAFSFASVNNVSVQLNATNTLTLHPGEFVTVDIPDGSGEDNALTVMLNGRQKLVVYDDEDGGSYAKLLMENSAAISEEMRYMLNSAVIMVPWLLCSSVLALYVLVIVVKRLVRRRVDDRAACQRPGMVLLIAAAVMAALTAINVLMTVLIQVRSADTVVLTNKTLQRAAEFLGLGTYAHHASQIVIYACLAVLCIRAIHHEFSRIRLVRLACVVQVMDLMTIFLGRVFDTLSVTEILAQLVPVLALMGLALSIRRDDPRRMVGKHWLPVSRTVLVTAVIFFVRQSYVLIFGTQTLLAVGMKALSGLPVLLLALLIRQRKADFISRMTFGAIACYFVANTVINLSMPAAIIIYTLGHCLLVWAYLWKRKLSRPRLIVWIVLAVLFEVQLFAVMRGLAPVVKLMAFPYIVAIIGVLVTAEKVSRRVQVGSILFLVSNQILGFTLLYPGDFLLESVELLLYYIAVIIMTSDPEALGVPADAAAAQSRA